METPSRPPDRPSADVMVTVVLLPKVRVPVSLDARLRRFCEETDRSIAGAVRLAIRRLCDDFEADS